MDELTEDELSNHLTWMRNQIATFKPGVRLCAGDLDQIVSSLDTAITLSKLQFNEINVHRSMHVGSSNLAERNGQMN